MFFKNKDKGVIKIKVTKTSTQAKYENDIRDKAIDQSMKCPECGHTKKESFNLGYSRDDGTNGYWGKCDKCGAEWDVNYKL